MMPTVRTVRDGIPDVLGNHLELDSVLVHQFRYMVKLVSHNLWRSETAAEDDFVHNEPQ